MTKKIKMVGTINGYESSVFKMGRKKLTFDATTLNLVQVALANGAVVGTVLKCNYGGTNYDHCDTTMVICAENSDRKFFADQIWDKIKYK